MPGPAVWLGVLMSLEDQLESQNVNPLTRAHSRTDWCVLTAMKAVDEAGVSAACLKGWRAARHELPHIPATSTAADWVHFTSWCQLVGRPPTLGHCAEYLTDLEAAPPEHARKSYPSDSGAAAGSDRRRRPPRRPSLTRHEAAAPETRPAGPASQFGNPPWL